MDAAGYAIIAIIVGAVTFGLLLPYGLFTAILATPFLASGAVLALAALYLLQGA